MRGSATRRYCLGDDAAYRMSARTARALARGTWISRATELSYQNDTVIVFFFVANNKRGTGKVGLVSSNT